ncbi:Smr/MutS family protein [Legionella nagasakiensis]|uniref:Smr/MutS family protein n=1 Tax=Legionella nagasakiensis TaxID=535290 RepID=UPI0010544594|nr:Smr/MutS family protein [Legionella nagasakiensis]
MSKDYLSDEEKALFRQAMHNVKPLNPSTNRTIKHRAVIPYAPKKPAEEPLSCSIYLSSQYSEPMTTNAILSYCEPSFSRKRFAQLKKGQIRWQAHLDLHGLSIESAKASLGHFIMKHYQLENRCLLIIHGKGGHYGEPPVLKSYVNHWLRQMPQVMAFHSTIPQDGGTGAVYLLLRRLNRMESI